MPTSEALSEKRARLELVERGCLLAQRGLAHGSSGNLSVRLESRLLCTPTGSSLGLLEADSLSLLDQAGTVLAGAEPTKEWRLHLAMYRTRSDVAAIVHLHSTHAAALSCLDGLPPDDVLPPLTGYYAMNIERLPLVAFFPPGDIRMAQAVEVTSARSATLLLANHGAVVGAESIRKASDIAEEIEATCQIFLALANLRYRPLTESQVAELRGGSA